MSTLTQILVQVFLLTYCANIYGFPLQAQKDPVAEIQRLLRETLEDFRVKMLKGDSELGIPSLEPLLIRNLTFKTSNSALDIHLHLHEVYLEGLSRFEIQDLFASTSTMEFRIRLKFPYLAVSGRYFVDGKIVKVVPVYGEGDYKITATHVSVGVATSLELEEESMAVSPLQLHLEWEDLKLDLANFLGGGSFSEVLQKALPDLGKKIFDTYRETILNMASEALTKKLNELVNSDKVKEKIQEIIAKAHMG